MYKTYLLIPHIHIQNANAMSSSYTIGFPAMTAWLGSVHAIQRKLNGKNNLEKVVLKQTAVICYKCNIQNYKGPRDPVYSIVGTANPLRKKGSAFERPPFIEEARVHLEVSLLIEASGINVDNSIEVIDALENILQQMKVASGDVMAFGDIKVVYVDEDNPRETRLLLKQLMPGYVLVERKDLMEQFTAEEDALDTLLSYLQVEHTALKNENGVVVSWNSKRKCNGWLVPIAVGFKGLATVGKVKGQRDQNKEHCFVESLVTLGEFKMSHRFSSIDDIMWHYEYIEEQQLYLCRNSK